MTRINLVTDPSLMSGSTYAYSAYGGAEISFTLEYAFYGSGAMKVVKASTRNSGVRVASPIPVTGGLPYAFSVYARIPVTIPKAPTSIVQLEITWTNSVGTVISQNTSALLEADDDTTWYRVGGVWTAPLGATQARMSVSFPEEGASSSYTLLDAFMAEQSNHIGGFFQQLPVGKKMEIVNKALSSVPQVINGVRLGADIILNDLTLNTVDEFGTVWVVTGLKGWWGQTNPDLPDIPRGTEEGSYDVQGRATARTLTLSGFFIPTDSESSLTASMDRLVAACNLIRTGGWFMANEGPNKAVWVRLSSAPDIETVNARGKTEFSITLRAGDPIKYHWDDSDPDGYTSKALRSSDIVDHQYINRATNPSCETSTGLAEIYRQRFPNPRATLTSRNPVYGPGGAGSASILGSGVDTTYAQEWTTAPTAGGQYKTDLVFGGTYVIPVTPGEVVRVDLDAALSGSSSSVRLVLGWDTAAGSYISLTNGPPTVVSSDWTSPTTVTVSGVAPANAGRVRVSVDLISLPVIGTTLYHTRPRMGGLKYFDGEYSPDADLTPSWTGTPGNSPSILSGRKYKGTTRDYTASYLTSAWSASGSSSFMLRKSLTNDPFTSVLSGAFELGKTYTVMFTTYTTEPVTLEGAISVQHQSGSWKSITLIPAMSPLNGRQDHRFVVNIPAADSDWTTPSAIVLGIRGDRTIMGPGIMYDNFAVVEGIYDGEWFSGDSEATPWESSSWAGTPHDSMSVLNIWDVDSVENIGTATVTGVFTFTGPAGAGTHIYNASTGERMVLEKPLRGAGIVASVDAVEATNNIATVYTTAPHFLRVGDEISFVGMVLPFSGVEGTRVLVATSDVFPYSVSFPFNTDDLGKISSGGQLFLTNNDVLVVDTYNRTVTFNGEESGHRSRLTTMTDWIHLSPGENIVQYFDDATKTVVYRKSLESNVATLTTESPHYLRVGEPVRVSLPETRPLLKKSLTNNKVTLVTAGPHGFAIGDKIDVNSTESATIVSKSRASNVVTLATETSHGVSVGDQITVSLPTSFSIRSKGATASTVTIASQSAHGFSAGDTVVVSLPTSATMSSKQLQNSLATITTTTTHGFVPGDSITISLPTVATTTGKTRSGGQVTLSTATDHGFSVGDLVKIALPTQATLTGDRVFSSSTNLVTYTTTDSHGFGVGDILDISLSPGTFSPTTKSATATECTLVLGTNHRVAVGDTIRVTGEGPRWDGAFSVKSVTSTSVSYEYSGGVIASTPAVGGAVNVSVVDHYNGYGVVESVPSTTTFTVREWGLTKDATAVASGSVTNTTNQLYNNFGAQIAGTPSPSKFTYNI